MASKKVRLQVASPCKASWEGMRGDDAVRFCGSCKKNVYSLSEMTTEAVEELLTGGGETPCVRFFQRADGTVMTADCSVGAARVRRKRAVVALSAGVLSAVGVALVPSPQSTSCAVPASAAEVAPPAVLEVPGLQPLEPSPPDHTAELAEQPIEVLGGPAYVEVKGEPVAIEVRGKPTLVEGARMGRIAAPQADGE